MYLGYDKRSWVDKPLRAESDNLSDVLNTIAGWIESVGIQKKHIDIFEKMPDNTFKRIDWKVQAVA